MVMGISSFSLALPTLLISSSTRAAPPVDRVAALEFSHEGN